MSLLLVNSNKHITNGSQDEIKCHSGISVTVVTLSLLLLVNSNLFEL